MSPFLFIIITCSHTDRTQRAGSWLKEMFPSAGLDKSLNLFLSVFYSNPVEAAEHCLYLSNPVLASTSVEEMHLLLIKIHLTKHFFWECLSLIFQYLLCLYMVVLWKDHLLQMGCAIFFHPVAGIQHQVAWWHFTLQYGLLDMAVFGQWLDLRSLFQPSGFHASIISEVLLTVSIWGPVLSHVMSWLCPNKALYNAPVSSLIQVPCTKVQCSFDPGQISLVTVGKLKCLQVEWMRYNRHKL